MNISLFLIKAMEDLILYSVLFMEEKMIRMDLQT